MLYEIETILSIFAAIVVIAGGIAALTKKGRDKYRKAWYKITRFRPKVPRETLRIIPNYQMHRCIWNIGSIDKMPAMQVHCDFFVTNITDNDARICGVSLKKPQIIGEVIVRSPDSDIYGRFLIPPQFTSPVSVTFWIQPPICNEEKPLVADIIFIDHFNNPHEVKKVNIRPRVKKKKEAGGSPLEVVSDLDNPVEREVVTVLQAELDRYKECGRPVGGLGSVQTSVNDKKIRGIGTDIRKADSPLFQEIVQDTSNVTIESDNASILTDLYDTLNGDDKNTFINALVSRLSRETAYAPVGYFIMFVLFRLGQVNQALETAKTYLYKDSEYGFSDLLRLLDGLLRLEYPIFTDDELNEIEQCLKGIDEHLFRIPQRIQAIRTLRISERTKKK
jgi:hypothetical protein